MRARMRGSGAGCWSGRSGSKCQVGLKMTRLLRNFNVKTKEFYRESNRKRLYIWFKLILHFTVGPQRRKIGKTSRTQNFRFLIIFSVKMGIFDVFEGSRLGLTPSSSSKITLFHHFMGIDHIGANWPIIKFDDFGSF